jgi:hypothetical protein
MKKIFLLVIQIALLPICLLAQSLPTPKEHFGFTIGEPYMLANFSQTEAYFKKIAELSDRVEYRSIGQTEFGREQPLLVITAPKNFPDLAIQIAANRAELLNKKFLKNMMRKTDKYLH